VLIYAAVDGGTGGGKASIPEMITGNTDQGWGNAILRVLQRQSYWQICRG